MSTEAMAVLVDLALEVGVAEQEDAPLLPNGDPLKLAERVGLARPDRAEVALKLASECGQAYVSAMAMRLAETYHHTRERIYFSQYAGIIWGTERKQIVSSSRYSKAWHRAHGAVSSWWAAIELVGDNESLIIHTARGKRIKLWMHPWLESGEIFVERRAPARRRSR